LNTVETSYKLLKKIKDDKFDVDMLHQYTLLLQIGVRDFQLCVVDPSNRCLLLEDYVLANLRSSTELLETLQRLFEEHHLLGAGFWKSVKVSFKNNKFSMIPGPLFMEEAMDEYLALNCQLLESEKTFYFKNLHTDAITVFAVNEEIVSWLQSVYANSTVGLVHQSSALIEGVLDYSKKYRNASLFLYIDRFKLHVVSLRKGKLEYYNQFSVKQFSDYVRYIMMVMKGLGYNQDTSKVVMWGYIGKQSPHFNEFYKFIRNISFGDRPSYLSFGYMFDEIQDHHFFDLYSTLLCE
jgi:hypothetical protein